VEKLGLPFESISAAKWRRYFSFDNFLEPFRFISGLGQAYKLIRKFKPDLILSAGAFVAVPVVLMGYVMKVTTFVHQQDLRVGLANRLMARFANVLTVSFDASLNNFIHKNLHLTGNPVRPFIFSGNNERAIKKFSLKNDLPVLLILGGSLGSEKINTFILEIVTELIQFCQVIHVTGRGNKIEWQDKESFGSVAENYQTYEYLDEDLIDALSVATVVLSRAGLSSLTELSALGKATLLMPIPDNQQEANAVYFSKRRACLVFDQKLGTAEILLKLLKQMLSNDALRKNLSANIHTIMPAEANSRYLELIKKALNLE